MLLTGVVPGTTASQILQDTTVLTLSQSKSSPIHDEVQVTDGKESYKKNYSTDNAIAVLKLSLIPFF